MYLVILLSTEHNYYINHNAKRCRHLSHISVTDCAHLLSLQQEVISLLIVCVLINDVCAIQILRSSLRRQTLCRNAVQNARWPGKN